LVVICHGRSFFRITTTNQKVAGRRMKIARNVVYVGVYVRRWNDAERRL